MTDRERIFSLKSYPYLGLFQYPLLPSIVRNNMESHHLLPVHNPYIGYYNHAFQTPTIIPKNKMDVGTQTDPVHSMLIGEKIIKAYGENYKILIE